ncbi:MAG: Fe-S cluster assembly protein SufD [Dysgonamonadaceae bacterium]|jgi:Fe-S cluster assembly protein SufD|nr:Fe-S cluster assembly protein SufD [Dysgonamonadaceae bacterium]
MKQYIDFFNSYRKEIDRGCAPLLNSYREAALDMFASTVLSSPRKRGSHDDPCAWDSRLHGNDVDFGFYLSRASINVNPYRVFRCDVPNLNSHKHFVVNGHFVGNKTQNDLPATVFSDSLNAFARQYPSLFTKYYNQIASAKEDGLSAFNTAFVQDGYVLYVPENVVIDRTVQLTNISAGNNNSLINRRMLFILERGAKAKILVCDHAYDECPITANTQVVEIYAGENAGFDFCELEESSPNTIRLTNCFVRQDEASEVRINSITLNNGTTRNNYTVDLAGKHAGTHLYGMAVADNRQKIDNYTLINHLAPNCKCRELFKYILDGEAEGVFNGRIIVAENARKTEAYQSNRNLLGSRSCRMFSNPQLEIYADDVKCSHGMTTGQLDEQALFYICSRGVRKEEAVLLLKFAFTDDVISEIRIDGMCNRLKMLVEKRFKGELVTCRDCGRINE